MVQSAHLLQAMQPRAIIWRAARWVGCSVATAKSRPTVRRAQSFLLSIFGAIRSGVSMAKLSLRGTEQRMNGACQRDFVVNKCEFVDAVRDTGPPHSTIIAKRRAHDATESHRPAQGHAA